MLTEVCAYLKNYFIRPDEDIHVGEFAIEDGSIELPFLLNGQYFRIVGSALNDGVWQYPETHLQDETFSGAVWAMRVPPSLIALADEIKDWQTVNAKAVNSPFQSESFGSGGYSYTTKSQSGNEDGGGAAFSWQNQFSARLNPYRRLSIL